jgi:hypothetical protein
MASATLNPAQQQALDSAFKRILRVNGGLNEDLPVNLSAAVNPYPTEARDFYVDATSGSDTAEGTSIRPFKTISRAAREILGGNHFDTRIFVGPGTYQENIKIQTLTPYSANIQIIGTDYTRATATTGSATGTATSFSTTTHKLLVSGAGWTASQFKGCMLRFTSGTLSASTQLPFPIYDNDDQNLEIPFLDSSIATGATGATFEIYKPAATIKYGGGSNFKYPIESTVYGNLGRLGLIVQNFILDGTNSTACASVAGGISFQGCVFQNTSSNTAGIVNSFAPGSILSIRNCYVSAPRVTTGWFWAAIFPRNSVFLTTGGHQFQLDFPGTIVNIQKMCYFEQDSISAGIGSAIFSLKVGQVNLYSTEDIVVKRCGHFIKAEGGNNNITFTRAINLISSVAAQGAIWLTEGGAYAGGGNRVLINAAAVTACTGPFLSMDTFHNNAYITNSTISNCGATAIKLNGNNGGNAIAGCFNFVTVYNATMSNNSADFTVDGTTTLSKAQAAAATNGTTTDSTLFNRLVVT